MVAGSQGQLGESGRPRRYRGLFSFLGNALRRSAYVARTSKLIGAVSQIPFFVTWRKRMGIEPTQERLHALAPDLKSGSPTSELGASKGVIYSKRLPLTSPFSLRSHPPAPPPRGSHTRHCKVVRNAPRRRRSCRIGQLFGFPSISERKAPVP